jgi:putative spermidine/putrescine transport system substrate-binding protein
MKALSLKPVLAALSVGVSLALAACGGGGGSNAPAAGSATSGTINIIGYAGIWKDAYQKAVLTPFTQKYPNIKVNYVEKRSSADMLASLRAERSRPNTDLAIMDKGVAISGNKQGVFAKITPTDVPNVANINKQFQNTGGYGPVIMADAVALLYDKQVFKEPPTSWNVLWDPAYKQKVAVMAPPSTLGLNFEAIVATMQGEDFTKSTTKAVAKLKELAPNVQTWMPTPDEYQAVITNQVNLSIGQNARGQYYADRSNGRLGVTFPSEGTVYQINTINLLNKAPHSAAAKTFINYALTPEAQSAFAQQLFYAPSVNNVQLPQAVKSRVVPTDGSLKVIPIDLEWFATVQADWTNEWKREIIR